MLVGPPAAVAADGDGVVLTLTGPAVPYAEVVYAIQARHGTVTARVTKADPPPFARREAVGLVPLEELPALLDEVELALGGLAAQRPADRAVVEVRLSRGDRRVVGWFAVDRSARGRALLALVRRRVSAVAGTLQFQDRLLLPGEAGRLSVTATPAARLEVDGVPMAAQTPVAALPLSVGPHEVRLTPLDGGEARVYPIKVERGRTTALVVDLR